MRKAKSFSHIGNHAINVLARLAAKNAVKEKLRGDGVRLTLVPPRDIAEKAQRYLADHPELYREALERALRLGLIKQHPMSMER
jgi:phosphate uptake regulator